MEFEQEPKILDPAQRDAALRTHLNDISTICQRRMLSALTGEEERQALAGIQRSVFRCAQVIYEGELARLLDDEIELHAALVPMDLSVWFGNRIRQVKNLLAQGDICLLDSHSERGPLKCMADEQLLDEMLYALIAHACRGMEKGGEIQVSLQRRGEYAMLIVGGGAGDPAQAIDRATPDLTPGAGSGMALRLCRAIAETHGGLLMAEAGPGGRFVASLQLQTDSYQASPLQTPLLPAWGDDDRALVALAEVLPVECFMI